MKTLTLKPLGARVIIAPEIETKSGSIHLPQCRVDMPNRGYVLALSDKARELGLAPGQRVLFDRHYQGLSEDQKTTIIDAKYVLAILG
jgi:co-chaperonin GroES (HSP10)